MRLSNLILVWSAVVLMFAVSGVSGFAQEQSGLDSLVGTGTVAINLLTPGGPEPGGLPQGNFTVAAHSNPCGDGAHGTIRVRLPGFAEATVKVECLLVIGNRAVAGGHISSGELAGWDLLLAVEDLGDPGPDTADAWITFGFDEPPCDIIYFLTFDILGGPFATDHGNYHVTDVPCEE